MPKLPEFIFDSYKRYKADTNQLTAWLVETAKRLGYVLEPTKSELPRTVPGRPNGRLKGKARKQAARKESPAASSVAEHRKIFVNEFAKLARFIAGSHDRIKVPSLVLKLARSAIAVRKRCAEWFKQRATHLSEDTSGETHWHFITVLEEVLQILDPLLERDDAKSVATETGPAAATLVNSFSLLDVEESEDEEFCQTLRPVDAQVLTNTPPRDQVVVYTVADDDTDEWLAIFCFFEDLRNIRAFLRETWSDYKDKKIDLITASVTTNMAFGIIRSMQEDLLALHSRLDSYVEIVNVLCSAGCISIGEDPLAVEADDILGLETIDVANFVYLHTYLVLLKCCDAIQPDHRTFPVYKPGHFGTYNPLQSRDSLSSEEKRAEDRIILFETLPDFVLIARLDRLIGQHPVQDELTKELQKMVSHKEISLLLVFAVQVYLDIHHVLRERVSRGLEDMRKAGDWVAASLRERSQNAPRVKFDNWPASNEECVEMLGSFIKEWILNDSLGAIKQPVLLRLLPNVPIEPYSLLRRHPFLCGMLQFRLQLQFQDLGLTLATAWGTILFVSHLYEAGKHAGFLGFDSWRDMEWIMSVHDKKRMFRGRVPQNVSESFKSLCLMAGTSTSYFASSQRATKKHSSRMKSSPKGPSFLKENSPVSAMFRDYGGAALTAETVEDLLADVGVDPSSLQLSKPQTKLQQQWARNHKMTQLQFLAALRTALVAEQHMIRFDYVSLHMRCIKLLRELKVTLHDKFVQYYGEQYMENETQLSWLVGWILATAAVSDKGATDLMKLRDGYSSNMLRRASHVVDAFIKREGHAECSKVEKVL